MTTTETLRQCTFKIIDDDKPKAVNGFLVVLIILNVLAVIVGSVNNIYDKYDKYFALFECFSVVIFTIEYALRLFTAPCQFSEEEKKRKKEKNEYHPYRSHIFSGMAMIDLLVILPFYFQFIFGIFDFDLRILWLFRMVRMLRILKLFRYYNSLKLITKILKGEKEKLFITFIFILVLILVSSTIMYFVETREQSEKFPNIIATLWWAVASLTTVGAGDVYPITPLGKILSGFIYILSIGLVALPSGIISAGLIKEVTKGTFMYKPEEIHSFLRRLRKTRDYIHKVLIAVAKDKTIGNDFTVDYRRNSEWHDENTQGIAIRYKESNNEAIICGLKLDIASEENENHDYAYNYCLAIDKKTINEDKITSEMEGNFPHIHDNRYIYIKMDKKLFLDDRRETELQKEITRILKGFFLKICKT